MGRHESGPRGRRVRPGGAAPALWFSPPRAHAADAMSAQGPEHEPDEAAASRYDALFDVYRELYPRTAELHRKLDDARDA